MEKVLHVLFLALLSVTACAPGGVARAAAAPTELTIVSVTLNGGASVTVTPGASITVNITVTTLPTRNWNTTGWRISTADAGPFTCADVPNPDRNGIGTFSESFTITAPLTAGTYNAYFIASNSGSCAGSTSAVGAISSGITVTPGVVTVGSFNAFEPSTAPATATTGVIRTKIAGSAFGLDVVAISGGALLATFSDNVRIELLANAGAPGSGYGADHCPVANSVIQTIASAAIAGGRSTVNFLPVADVYQDVRVRISHPTATPTVASCSTDSFAIRPASFSVSVTDNDWETAGRARDLDNGVASGGVVHKAGRFFTISVTPNPGTATSYAGSPIVAALACGLPTGCVNGVLGLGIYTGTGTRSSSTAAYTEVGTFNLTLEDQVFADIDVADSPPAERYVPQQGAPITVGRFVPNHFDVAQLVTPQFRTFNASDAQCSAGAAPRRTFTYIGQPFGYVTRPQATIIARNFAGTTTTNYLGALWKIGAGAVAATKDCTTTPNTCVYTSTFGASGGTVTENYTYTLALVATPGWDNAASAPAAATVTSNNNGTGTIAFAASGALAFQRSLTTPQAAFTATINNSIRATDNSEAAGVITTTTPADFPGISFDAGNQFYYGRLRLENAYGSTLISMPLPLRAQRWDGTAFVTNDLDNCTTIAAANIAIGNPQNGLTAAMVSPPTVGGAFSAGIGNLRLPAPTGRQSGSVDVSINLGTTTDGASCAPAMPAIPGGNLAHLRGLWCTPPGNYTSDPTARATFGLRGANPFIYQRENFQ